MGLLRGRGFGQLTLSSGRRCVRSFPSRRAEELLGYLLLTPGVAHAREELIGRLWPGDDPRKARPYLRTTLWRFRSVFKELGLSSRRYLRADRRTITFLAEPPFDFDVQRFEAAVRGAKSAGETAEREQRLRDAAAQYKDPFFAGIDAGWCLIARESLARQHLWAVGQLMVGSIQRREYEQAIGYGQTILADYVVSLEQGEGVCIQ